MRKLIIHTSLTILISLSVNIRAGIYSGGTGEPNDPYRIATPNDLNDIGNHPEDSNKCFIMTADIDLSGYTGTQFNIIMGFTGVFDGNGHTISNFTYDAPSQFYIGLFHSVDGLSAVVKNLRLDEPYVVASDSTGALAGSLNGGTVSNCSVTSGGIIGGANIGGLVGNNNSGIISNCYSTTNISVSGLRAGGMVANNSGGTIERCYASGIISGWQGIGGLVGSNYSDGLIAQSYATGDVSGENWTGGLVGSNYGIVSNCYATGDVSGESEVGGLVGIQRGYTVEGCYATGYISGLYGTGGLIGKLEGGTAIDSFWDTETSGQWIGVGSGSSSGVTGKTTAEMKLKSTFTSWDFAETWGIEDNQTYPFLRLSYPVGDVDLDKDVDFMDFAHFADHWLEGAEL